MTVIRSRIRSILDGLFGLAEKTQLVRHENAGALMADGSLPKPNHS